MEGAHSDVWVVLGGDGLGAGVCGPLLGWLRGLGSSCVGPCMVACRRRYGRGLYVSMSVSIVSILFIVNSRRGSHASDMLNVLMGVYMAIIRKNIVMFHICITLLPK